MAHKSESSKTTTGASITTVGGTNISRAQVKAMHNTVMITAEIIGITDGERVEVHVGTQAARCGTRREGVHYMRGRTHYLGVRADLTHEGGFKRNGLEVLAHEMTHAQQYGSGRLARGESQWRCGTWQMTYTFSGAWNGTHGARSYDNQTIPRPRNPSYNTYRNFPWEQEAWETQAQVADQVTDILVEGTQARIALRLAAITEAPVVQAAGKYDCPHCGRKYASYAGRYNHLRKNQCPNHQQ